MEKGINQEKPISSVIRERIREAGAPFAANDNIAQYIREGEMPQLEAELEEKIQGVLETLLIDTENDHNTRETAHRVAKMYLGEVFSGRYTERPRITEFPNVKQLNQIYTVGPDRDPERLLASPCSDHGTVLDRRDSVRPRDRHFQVLASRELDLLPPADSGRGDGAARRRARTPHQAVWPRGHRESEA